MGPPSVAEPGKVRAVLWFLEPGLSAESQEGLKAYYKAKIEEAELAVRNKTQNLRRLEAQRNELNSKGTRSYPGGRFRKRLTRQPPGPPQCVCCARSCRCSMSRGRTWARW